MLAYQARWAREIAPVAVALKSRRIGFSWVTSYRAVMRAAENKGNTYYQSYSKDMTRTFILDAANWCRDINAAAGAVEEFIVNDPDSDREIQVYRIDLATGKEIVAMTSAARAFRSKGKPGDEAVVDEAAYVEDLEAVLEAALAFTIWGGSVRIISTPNGTDNPYWDLVEDIRARRMDYALHEVDLDDAIADGLVAKISAATGAEYTATSDQEFRDRTIRLYGRHDKDEAVLQELFLTPRRSGSVYFSRELIEARMIDAPVLTFQATGDFESAKEPERRARMSAWLDTHIAPLLKALDNNQRHAMGFDFARTAHLSVVSPIAIAAGLRRRVPFLLEMKRVPHAQQVQALFYIVERLPRFSGAVMDATGSGEYSAEALHDVYGSLITQQKISESWYAEQMPRYKAAYEDQLISVPRSDDILSDHRSVQAVGGIPKLPPAQANAGRHGDSVIAICMAWQASCGDHAPLEVTIAGEGDDVGRPDGRPPLEVSYMGGMNDSMAGYL